MNAKQQIQYFGIANSTDDDVRTLGDTNPIERQHASERLLKASKDAMPALLKGLEDSNDVVKSKSLWIIRQIKAKGVE